ncbi:flagellar filament capping protein FliD [Chengkuizengella sp. SCS-71B]|uniref:flagellar filament capping protein FliD n=1 Tax=Chengkuizengella sp. SCS-71B TaxID=3115290 RepID=UPI0032C244F8
MAIRFTGIASGIDTESIVRDLMNVERLKLTKVEQKNQITEWKREDYLDLNSKILDYRNNKVFNYTLQGTLSSKKTQLYGDTSSISVNTNNNAFNGTIQIEVMGLATAASNYSRDSIANDDFDSGQSLQSQESNLNDGATLPGTYTFSINGTEIEVNTAEDSLDDIIKKINDNTDVSAFYSDTEKKVSFIAKNTGASTIQFDDLNGDFLSNILSINPLTDPGDPNSQDTSNELAGTNAVVKINGLETHQSSNKFDVNGVEITLQNVGSPTTIEVSSDVDAMVDSIKQFIEDYNEILTSLNEEVREEQYRDYAPLTEDEKDELTETEIELWEDKARSGLLKNDDYITGAIDSMRSVASIGVDTGSDIYKTLSSIGITTGSYDENGILHLDEDKLREAIEAEPDSVVNMFTASPSSDDSMSGAGVAEIIYESLGNTLSQITEVAGSSTTSFDESILGKEMRELDKEIEEWEDRLILIEDRYYDQFTAMEMAMQTYNSQLEYILGAFGGQQA